MLAKVVARNCDVWTQWDCGRFREKSSFATFCLNGVFWAGCSLGVGADTGALKP